MIESYIRPAYQRLFVNSFAAFLHVKGCKPAWITFLAGLCGIGAAFFIVFHHPFWAASLLLLSGYFDTLDGTVARYSHQDSPQGSVLDISIDRIVEFSVILGLFYIDPLHRAFACLWMLGAVLLCVTTFLVVGIFIENDSQKSFHYSAGLIERAEAFGFFILMILLPSWFLYFAWTFTSLVLLTAAIRLWEFYKAHN